MESPKENKRLYAAYGSNLDGSQMARRCPGNEFFATGNIVDYRLTLTFYADIEPDLGKMTPCALYLLSPDDEKRLDGYEGVAGGCYRKIEVAVKTEKRTYAAFSYAMTEEYKALANNKKARPGYKGQIAAAYEQLGFTLPEILKNSDMDSMRTVKVFVYGTLKRKYHNHLVMEEAQGQLLGAERVEGFACINCPGFPYAIQKDGHAIVGEVYEVPIEGLRGLDMLEGVPDLFVHSKVVTTFGEAIIYTSAQPLQHLVALYGFTEDWNR